jgi:hypothetical protein
MVSTGCSLDVARSLASVCSLESRHAVSIVPLHIEIIALGSIGELDDVSGHRSVSRSEAAGVVESIDDRFSGEI